MAIRIAHQPSAYSIGDAAFAMGANEALERRKQRQVAYDQMALQFDMDQSRRLGRRYEFDKQHELAVRSADRMDEYYDALNERMDRYDPVELERVRQQGRLQELALKNPDFADTIAMRTSLNGMSPPQFTPAQQKRIDKINMMRGWVSQKVATGEWTPDEASQVLEQSEMELMNIKPLKKRDRDFNPEEEFINSVSVDPFTGERWLYNDGKWENITPKAKKEQATASESAEAQSKLLGHFLEFVKYRRAEAEMNAIEIKDAKGDVVDTKVDYPTIAELRKEFNQLAGIEPIEEPADAAGAETAGPDAGGPDAAVGEFQWVPVAETARPPQGGQAATPQIEVPRGYQYQGPESVFNILRKNPGDFNKDTMPFFAQKVNEYVRSKYPEATGSEFVKRYKEAVIEKMPQHSEMILAEDRPQKSKGIKQPVTSESIESIQQTAADKIQQAITDEGVDTEQVAKAIEEKEQKKVQTRESIEADRKAALAKAEADIKAENEQGIANVRAKYDAKIEDAKSELNQKQAKELAGLTDATKIDAIVKKYEERLAEEKAAIENAYQAAVKRYKLFHLKSVDAYHINMKYNDMLKELNG